jgi:hypothetical protein
VVLVGDGGDGYGNEVQYYAAGEAVLIWFVQRTCCRIHAPTVRFIYRSSCRGRLGLPLPTGHDPEQRTRRQLPTQVTQQ